MRDPQHTNTPIRVKAVYLPLQVSMLIVVCFHQLICNKDIRLEVNNGCSKVSVVDAEEENGSMQMEDRHPTEAKHAPSAEMDQRSSAQVKESIAAHVEQISSTNVEQNESGKTVSAQVEENSLAPEAGSQTLDDSTKFISKLEKIKKAILRKTSTEKMLLERQVIRSEHTIR
jgi:hypothetical protein